MGKEVELSGELTDIGKALEKPALPPKVPVSGEDYKKRILEEMRILEGNSIETSARPLIDLLFDPLATPDRLDK